VSPGWWNRFGLIWFALAVLMFEPAVAQAPATQKKHVHAEPREDGEGERIPRGFYQRKKRERNQKVCGAIWSFLRLRSRPRPQLQRS
jgi:hypothetical protein